MSKPAVYRVIFHNQNQVFEIYVKSIYQSDLYGFIEVEEFLFGERSKMVVDPSEEKLKNLFNDVNRSYIPTHSIIRIDEVEQQGVSKVSDSKGGNISPFPIGFSGPQSRGGE